MALHCDSSAAIGIAFRQGLGKVRHLQVQELWLQQKLLRKDLSLKKVPGALNGADLMTKYLAADTLQAMVRSLGYAYMTGRAASAPQLSRSAQSGTVGS